MNKKKYHYLLAPAVLLMAGVAVSGCSDRDEAAPQVTAKAGEPILFGIADPQSRTHYTEDKYQIDWDIYDKIGIYSDKAVPGSGLGGKKFAYYMINQVFPDTDPVHDYHGAIVPVANKDVVEITESGEAPSLTGDNAGEYGLMWGDKDTFSEEYTFYGAYPACRITKSPADETGYFTMEYHTNQTVTVESVSNGVYTTKPDMLNAYMMAEKEILPTEDHVLLDFDPIMTTLDIHITAGGYELGTGIINPVTITGVSVMMPGALTNQAVKYKVADGTTGELLRLSDVDASKKESVFVGIDNYGKRYVDLFEGESISLLAFLPPMDMKNGVKIRVHAVGALNFEVTVNEEMIKQSRIDIQLPDVKPSSEMTPEQAALQTNNWITQLDGNIQLAQLSIPEYDCDGSEDDTKILALLNAGVRAFDITDITDNKNNINVFNTFINENQGEFIITLVDGLNNTPSGLNKSDVELNANNWQGTMIESLRGKIISFEWYRVSNNYVQADKSAIPSNYLFEFEKYNEETDFLSNTKWNLWYISSKDDYVLNQSIYNQIANEQIRQSGCTGMLMVPCADETRLNGQYTYSDLLIQAIIDCNYKFILDRN